MIESIQLQNTASFGDRMENLSCLKDINFIYGSNGTGKTTISRVIADPSKEPSCLLNWQSDYPLETMVYNQDFIEDNYNQASELKGIFTLGEEDKGTLAQIQKEKDELEKIKEKGIGLRETLGKLDENTGKIGELKKLSDDFNEKCWELKKKYEATFRDAFKGVLHPKTAFANKLLLEKNKNTAALNDLESLKQKAETIFGKNPVAVDKLKVLNLEPFLNLHTNPILEKIIIGKGDVNIAGMIKRLDNSAWVSQGKAFLEKNNDTCPFCQREIQVGFANSLASYFDETYKTDITAINTLIAQYKTNSESLLLTSERFIENPSEYLNIASFKVDTEKLKLVIRDNQELIQKKKRETNIVVKLISIEENIASIKEHIKDANVKIERHNTLVKNIGQEKEKLTAQIWKYLLECEIKNDLAIYQKAKKDQENAIKNIKENITSRRQEYKEKEALIKSLEKKTTSIQPTINAINSLLSSFGFTGFTLAKSSNDRCYKIIRANGQDAQKSLSEGEKTFVTFLYFYHLLKGSVAETGTTSNRVVVFDDPISSLDSDILFIVSSLIKGLINEVGNTKQAIKQIFILTHNVYFFKEVSFSAKREVGKKFKNESFWTVSKPEVTSKLREHQENPIKTSYELLWREVRETSRSNLSIQNTLRRILENYFKILGNINSDIITKEFNGKEQLICQSLLSWINDGSHAVHEDLYMTTDDSIVERYLEVFKSIFIKMNHEAHYNMMMGSIDEN